MSGVLGIDFAIFLQRSHSELPERSISKITATGGLLVKHLETSRTVWNDIDLISFRGEKPPQNPLQSTIVLDHQNRLHCGRAQSGSWSVQGSCEGSWFEKGFDLSAVGGSVDPLFLLFI
jgi:hypothetical protein